MPEKTPWDERTTLLRPPPNDKSKSPIENALEVTELGVLGPVRLHLCENGRWQASKQSRWADTVG